MEYIINSLFVISVFTNICLVYLVVKYNIIEKERKYRALKIIKYTIKEITDVDITSDDINIIVSNIKSLEKEYKDEIDEQKFNNLKSESLKLFLKGYFKNKSLTIRSRFITFIAETLVCFAKKYGA